VRGLNIKLQLKWYDLWVGAYIDKPNRTVYICPIPMIVIKITLPKPHYLIIGNYTNSPIGCCIDPSDVIEQCTFQKIKKKNCPICNRA